MIRDFIADHGYSPTIREIGTALGIRSPEGVKCHLRPLRAKGVVAWVDGKSRTIQIVEAQPQDPDQGPFEETASVGSESG